MAQDKESFSHEYNCVILHYSFFRGDGPGALGEVVLKHGKLSVFKFKNHTISRSSR